MIQFRYGTDKENRGILQFVPTDNSAPLEIILTDKQAEQMEIFLDRFHYFEEIH